MGGVSSPEPPAVPGTSGGYPEELWGLQPRRHPAWNLSTVPHTLGGLQKNPHGPHLTQHPHHGNVELISISSGGPPADPPLPMMAAFSGIFRASGGPLQAILCVFRPSWPHPAVSPPRKCSSTRGASRRVFRASAAFSPSLGPGCRLQASAHAWPWSTETDVCSLWLLG